MGHTFIRHIYHIVFSTKDRRPLIRSEDKQRLYEYMIGIARNCHGVVLEINGIEDHVHVVTTIAPRIAVAEFVQKLKANSSGWASESLWPDAGFAWQVGYASFTVSESALERVLEYVQNQEEHHKKRSFAEELEALLKRHRVAYDPEHYLD